MILYYKGAFGINLLWRLRGSAVYRAMVHGLLSVGLLLLIRLVWRENDSERDLLHPYAVGVLLGSVSFLIVFRANHGYSRYWEATGAIHHMMSKWMDATTHTSCYHMQCDHYKLIKPPSYFDHPELNEEFLTRARERSAHIDDSDDAKKVRAVQKSIEATSGHGGSAVEESIDGMSIQMSERREGHAARLKGKSRLDGGWLNLFPPLLGKRTSTFYHPDKRWNADGKGFASTSGGRTPALFLQELAHLCSLLNAVALSTLRNDIDGAESPLDIYEPGSPWPEADPDLVPDAKVGWSEIIKYITGSDRSAQARTDYNARRPLPVIGGVSHAEIRFLQTARGPYAKTQLCWNWLSEFIIREHLAGTLGKVGPPIISRVVQFLSDGMVYYNHARKIMYVPFPFPHAQISVFFVIATIFAVPFLMDQYTADTWLGVILTFLTTTCLAGLHEVARELENPFRNVPNDLPVCTFQAFFNEALITMYAGYHPDAYWNPHLSRRGLMKSKSSMAMSKKSVVGSIPEGENEDASEQLGTNNASSEAEPSLQSLKNLIEAQGREIDRLRKVVEGETKKGK